MKTKLFIILSLLCCSVVLGQGELPDNTDKIVYPIQEILGKEIFCHKDRYVDLPIGFADWFKNAQEWRASQEKYRIQQENKIILEFLRDKALYVKKMFFPPTQMPATKNGKKSGNQATAKETKSLRSDELNAILGGSPTSSSVIDYDAMSRTAPLQ